MFTHRKSLFKTANVLAFLGVILACVSLPLATSDERSVALAGHPGSTRRSPNLLFKVPEGSSHARLAGSQDVHYRRSLNNEMKKDDDYVPQRMPAFSHQRANHRRTEVYPNIRRNQNHNINININNGGGSGGDGAIEQDQTVFKDIDIGGTPLRDDSQVDKLEAKLYSCVIFRVNMIEVFGQILKAPNNGLTTDQYSSLNLIQQALIHKQVYTFNMLPILKKLQNADVKSQFKMVMHALANSVPAYMACICMYWENQIEKDLVDIEKITASFDQSAKFLARLDTKLIDICMVTVSSEESEPFDEASEVTKETLGPVFVNIFNMLKNHEITLSPKLFGAILINLPVGKLNPVLEEYIDYVWDVMRTNPPQNWNQVAPDIEYGTPYEVVKSVLKKLLSKGGVPDNVGRMLKYILMHLREVPNTFSDEYYPDMEMLLSNGGNLELMFSMIQDDVDIPELSDLRDRMIIYIKEMKVTANLKHMNKYTYGKPIDMIIAQLARIQARTQETEIRDTATKLLSIFISKEEISSFGPTISADVDLSMLLDYFNMPDIDPDILALGQKIQKYLDADLDLSINMQELMLKEDKSKCQEPIECLLQLFTKTVDSEPVPGLGMTSDLIKIIRQLLGLIKNTTDSSQCESHGDVCVEKSETMDHTIDGELNPEFTVEPVTLPTSKPTSPTVSSFYVTSDYDESSTNLDYPNSPSPDTDVALLPTDTYDNVDDSPSSTVSGEDLSVELLKPKRTSIPKSQSQSKPKPVPMPIPTVIPTAAPLQHIKPSNKPPLLTTPRSPPMKKPPAEQKPNNLSPQAENEPFLPPNLGYDRPMYFVFPQDGGPPYMSTTRPSDSDDVVEFYSIETMLQGFNPNTPFSYDEIPDIPKIFGPLKHIVGVNFVEEILAKRVDKNDYPTVISLVDDLLDHALDNPKVMENPELYQSIQQYLKGIDYMSTLALFPVVIDSLKISSDVIYVTFDPDNPNANSVDSEPPLKTPDGFTTLPLYHPKFWVQQVDQYNPYGTLLPSQVDGEDNPIQELINDGSLQEILGPDFDPLLYPNKGSLLTTVLQKLMASERVESNFLLMKKVSGYLMSIRNVAMYNKVPSNHVTHLLEMQQSNEVNWQPDTTSLITALPPARNHREQNKINLIKTFLETPNLMELLGIKHLPYSTTRSSLLKMIFDAAIRGDKIVLDRRTLAALKYYEGKIMTRGLGASPIIWSWVQMYIVREEVPLGEIIESVIDYDKLHHHLQISYNKLVTYLSENPELLQSNDDFAFDKYPTKGTFLKGLFYHFLRKPGVSPRAKKYMSQLLPFIILKGRGMESMNKIMLNHIKAGEIVRSGIAALMNG